jgi:Rod binding domain-containing protein
MDVSAINRGVQAADLPLEKLATTTKVDDREKIAEVSRQFEAVLLRQILGQAQKPLFKSGLLESSNSSNSIYQDLVTQQLADRISRGGSFGFASVLEHQLAAQYIQKESEPGASHSDHPKKEAGDIKSRTLVATHPSVTKSIEPHAVTKTQPTPAQ